MLVQGKGGQPNIGLLFLREGLYKAWREKMILRIVISDSNGAYNGVCKDRLCRSDHDTA